MGQHTLTEIILLLNDLGACWTISRLSSKNLIDMELYRMTVYLETACVDVILDAKHDVAFKVEELMD